MMYHRDLTEETCSSQANNAGAVRGDPVPGGKLADAEEDTQTVQSSSSIPSGSGGGVVGVGGKGKRRHHASTEENSCAGAAAAAATTGGGGGGGGGGGFPSCCDASSSLCQQQQQQQQQARHRHVGGITDDALRHFDDAMALIEPKVKLGYQAAIERCPSTVFQHECCPCYFLLACQSNPWDAALKMCAYWKERVHLFQDRAFEAITLGSDGNPPTGLFPQDMEILETGAVLLLPSDRDGRTVLWCYAPGLFDGPVRSVEAMRELRG